MMNVTIKYRVWLAGLFLSSMLGTNVATASELSAEVWKDPNCGCCNEWVQHLEEVGIQVRTSNTGSALPSSLAPAIPPESAAMPSKAMYPLPISNVS